MSDVYLEGRKTQQHRLERLVKNHFNEFSRDIPTTTELEKVQRLIINQFVDAVKREGQDLTGFDSIYLK